MCDDSCNRQDLMYRAHTGRKVLLFLAVACWQLPHMLSRRLFITLSMTDKTLHNTILWCRQIDLFRESHFVLLWWVLHSISSLAGTSKPQYSQSTYSLQNCCHNVIKGVNKQHNEKYLMKYFFLTLPPFHAQ